MYKYTKIKGLDSREITSLPKNKNVVEMTRVISTIAEKNCMLITRLIGRDDICNDVITVVLIGGNLMHDSSVDRERCSCEALLPFSTLPLENPAKLALRPTS